MPNRDGREAFPTHRCVDQQPDIGRIDPGFRERLSAGHRRGVGERHVLGPPAPFDDAGQPLEEPGADIEARVGVSQGRIDLR